MTLPMKITGTSRFRKSKRKANIPLLPGDAGILKQIEMQRAESRNRNMINEPLEYAGPIKNFGPLFTDINAQLGATGPKINAPKDGSTLDIVLLIRRILDHMFIDYPMKDSGRFLLSSETMSENEEFRRSLPPVVTLNQLYGVFPRATTEIDQAIGKLATKDQIKLLPVSSTDGSMDIVIESKSYYEICDSLSPELGTLCRSKPSSTWFYVSDLTNAGVDISEASTKGLLLADPSKPGVHCLALPHQGRFLKLVRLSRTWLINTITQYNRRFKEIIESQLQKKLETNKRYWRDMRGVNLHWILYDAIGGGWVDGFQTPIDRGWKLLKR